MLATSGETGLPMVKVPAAHSHQFQKQKQPKKVDTLSSELNLKQRQFGTNVRINLITTFVTNVMICNKYNDEVIVLAVYSGGVLQEV